MIYQSQVCYFVLYYLIYPGMVRGPGTHVEDPVLSNGTVEVPKDFCQNFMDCGTGFD